ncbi:hypothetical protein [Nitrososphaera sp.]|uniref:hypothetical protein n=1 Tax=Nitrososphaera sp. TaxID=1971748 RepID=UPI003180462F
MTFKGLAIVVAAILGFAMLLPITTTNNAYADTETISISSGDGPFFGPDSSITMLVGPQDTGFNVPLTPADFAAASSGPSAIVVPNHPAWVPTLAVDPAAKYISTHAIHPNAHPSVGLILSSALYAVDFEVTSATVDSATLDIYFHVDNQLGDNANEGVFVNGIPVANTKGGSFGADYSFLDRDVTSMVHPGTNTLYVLGVDVGGPSGLQFHVDITVESNPNTAPDVSNAQASTTTLWPPNNKMVPITVQGVTDADGDAVTITITSIMQDEKTGKEADASGVGTDTASVRAERDGKGDGRVYHIAFTADDGNGGVTAGEVTVTVPHDQSGSPAVDGGALYDSTVSS